MTKFRDAMRKIRPLNLLKDLESIKFLCLKLAGWNPQNELLLQKSINVKLQDSQLGDFPRKFTSNI